MALADVMRKLGWQRNKNRKVWIDGEQVYGYWREEPQPDDLFS
jgi:hypothetical protein